MGDSWRELLPNIAILAILVTVWTHGLDLIEGKGRWYRAVFGAVLSAAGVILLMQVPFEIRPGVFTDLRGALIALAGFFGSPLIGIVAGLTAAAYRIHLGGAGVTGGIVSIVTCAAVGIGGYFVRRGRPATIRDLLGFAIATSLAVPLGFLVLPPAIVLSTLTRAGPVLTIMTFVAIVLAGLVMIEADRRRETAHANVFYRGIIDSLPEPVNAKDLAGRFLAANPATARQVNVPGVAALIGKSDFDFFPEDVARRFRADEERVLATGEPETIEQVVTREDGSRQWLSTLKVPLRDQWGAIIGLLTHNHDITERKHMEDEIAEGRRRLQDATEHMADGLVMYDREARIVLCNDQYRAMFPKTADLRVPGVWLETILRASIARGEQSDIPSGAIETWIQRTIDGLSRPGERDIHLADGRWLTARTRPTDDGGALSVIADITETKRSEVALNELNRRLANLASEDGLTGLMNRRGYDDALQRAFAQNSRNGTPLSLLLIDVDRFKAYNDTYGHPAGDDCLRTIGNLLKLGLRRPGDVAARHGGEEFAAILPDTPEEGALMLAETLRKTVHGLGMEHTGSAFGAVTISIGLATATPGGPITRGEDLAELADAALYAAKAGGRNRTAAAEPKKPLAAIA